MIATLYPFVLGILLAFIVCVPLEANGHLDCSSEEEVNAYSAVIAWIICGLMAFLLFGSHS